MPGEALLSAPVLAAMGLTAVNDHWWKAAAPGWFTGKLSDFAGLFFFPFLAVALGELGCELFDRVRRGARAGRPRGPSARGFALLLFLEGAVFGAIKASPAYAAWLGESWGAVLGIHARFTPDPTDLCALIVLPVAWRTARSRGLVRSARIPSSASGRGKRSRWPVLLPLGFFLGGCTSFRIPGYEGRPVDYVAREVEDGRANERGLPAPRLVRSEDALLVLYPFRVAWLPRVDWNTPGQHGRSLEGWIWIENASSAPIRVAAPRLGAPAGVPIAAQVFCVGSMVRIEGWHPTTPLHEGMPIVEHEIAPGAGAWVQARIPVERDLAADFELRFAWLEGGRERTLPVHYSRTEP